mgnify:CR=1 FL=1
MITLENLGKSFDGKIAVQNLSFTIKNGEIFSLLGPNGAGKTTTIRMLSGIIKPTWGNAFYDSLSILDSPDKIRKNIGLLPENPGFYDRLSGYDNLKFFAKLYGINDLDERIKNYLKDFDLLDHMEKPFGTYSKGMKQKLAIVRAIMHDPEYLFLDEPTASLDPQSAKWVRDFIKSIRNEGKTVLLCTHNLNEAEILSDRIAILKNKLIAVGSPEELKRELFGNSIIFEYNGEEEKIKSALNSINIVYEIRDKKLKIYLDNEKQIPQIIKLLLDSGIDVYYVYKEKHTLEDIYLEMLK